MHADGPTSVPDQTGVTGEHRLRRRLPGPAEYAGTALLEWRVQEPNAACVMDRGIADVLDAGGIGTAHGVPFVGENMHLRRKR